MMRTAKPILCLLVLCLLAGAVSADNMVVQVTDTKNKPVSNAGVNITACGILKSDITDSNGTCTMDISKTCNKVQIYINGALKYVGKYQEKVFIKVQAK